MIKPSYQLLVIGAGPAGMAAALTAANHGVEVAVVDEQAQPGGQIYRNLDASPLPDINLLGKDYVFGRQQVQAFRHAHLDYFPGHSVWYLDKAGEVGIVADGIHHSVNAQRIIIACGAQERPLPFPGWELPGVMTAGAGQILMKSAAVVPTEPPLLVGSGPLLLLLAWQYLRAGVGVRAIVDTTDKSNRWHSIPKFAKALAACDYLFKGVKLMTAIKCAGVPWYRQASQLRAEGDERLKRLCFSCDGKSHHIDTSLVMLHQGVVPALHITEAAGCETLWNPAQQSWQPAVDAWGESSRLGIFISGDGAGIGGARVASLGGRVAGLQVARQLDCLEPSKRDRLARPLRNARQRHLAIRPFLDAYYRVADDRLVPEDKTLVCRCEEIDAAEIRTVAALGCSGPNQAKAFTRCGMGPCQGRFCSATVAGILAREAGRNIDEVGRYSVRPPLKPITLGQLAGNDGD